MKSKKFDDHKYSAMFCICGRNVSECKEGHLRSEEHREGVWVRFENNDRFENIMGCSLLYGNHLFLEEHLFN